VHDRHHPLVHRSAGWGAPRIPSRVRPSEGRSQHDRVGSDDYLFDVENQVGGPVGDGNGLSSMSL
jgi:hypothetical protein